MRCNASLPTCTAAEPAARDAAVQRVVDAVLFRAILTPLGEKLGPLAATALDEVAQQLATRERPR